MCSSAQCAKQRRKASGITHERWPDFRHRKKKQKQKRGEFKTPPRPTGRRSNKLEVEMLAYTSLISDVHKSYRVEKIVLHRRIFLLIKISKC